MLNHLGEVKRTDLNLRTEYLGLHTKIYRMESERYLILCENYKGDFEELKKHFDYSIRPMCCPIELADKEPKEFKEIIESIPLDDIISDFQGVCLTQPEIDNMITSKFHHIDFINIFSIPGGHAKLTIVVSDHTGIEDISELEEFLSKMELSFEEVIVGKESDEHIKYTNFEEGWEKGKSLYNDDPMFCFTDKSFPFSVNDADYWFSNVEGIYQGKIDRGNLPFFNQGESKCYLDFTQFKNINLRNNILLYDKVYLALPIGNKLDTFLEHQNITKNELIELVEREKLVFLLPNTESRYDRDLVMEAYRHKDNSVISKRGINALMACYMTEIEKTYLAKYPKFKQDILEIGSYLKDIKDKNTIYTSKMITWPLTAKLESFRTLNQGSPIAIGNFGVNKVIEDKILELEETNELSFQFMVNSSNIHIATALQATYFPFNEETDEGKYSDSGVSSFLAGLLNSYYYSSLGEVEQIKKVTEINQRENNYINFLNTDNTISITKFAEKAEKHNTEAGLANILNKLEYMDEKERREKISDYNTIICDIGEIPDKERLKCLKYFLGVAGLIPTLSLPMSLGVNLANLGLSMTDKVLSKKKETGLRQIEYKINKITKEKPENEIVEDVYMLDKIARIAKLQ